MVSYLILFELVFFSISILFPFAFALASAGAPFIKELTLVDNSFAKSSSSLVPLSSLPAFFFAAFYY